MTNVKKLLCNIELMQIRIWWSDGQPEQHLPFNQITMVISVPYTQLQVCLDHNIPHITSSAQQHSKQIRIGK